MPEGKSERDGTTMAMLTNLFGTIEIRPRGASQNACTFVAAETLANMPALLGTPADKVFTLVLPESRPMTEWTTIDPLGRHTRDGNAICRRYMLVTNHSANAYMLLGQSKDAVREWLNELACRIRVTQVLLCVGCEDGSVTIDGIGNEPSVWTDYADLERRPSQDERASDWRYEPELECYGTTVPWDEILVNEIPGGNAAYHELDELAGHKDPNHEEDSVTLRASYERVLGAKHDRDEGLLPWDADED